MTEVLILLLVAAAYLLGRARDERDRLMRVLAERHALRPAARPHWQPIDAQLEAERQAATLERAARQAMHRVVDDPPRPASAAAAPPTRSVRSSRTRHARPEALVRASGLSADEVARITVRRSR